MFRLFLSALALTATAFTFTACNTVDGAGEDLQEASDNTSEAFENATN